MGKPSLEIECLRSSDWNSAEARHCLKERGWKAVIERLKTRYFRVVELEGFEQFQQGSAIGRRNSQHPGGEQFRWKRPGRDRQVSRCENSAHREETRRLRRSAIEINDSRDKVIFEQRQTDLFLAAPNRFCRRRFNETANADQHPFRQVEDSLMNLWITKL